MVTITESKQLLPNLFKISFSSDIPDATYYIYINGLLIKVTTETNIILSVTNLIDHIEIYDDINILPVYDKYENFISMEFEKDLSNQPSTYVFYITINGTTTQTFVNPSDNTFVIRHKLFNLNDEDDVSIVIEPGNLGEFSSKHFKRLNYKVVTYPNDPVVTYTTNEHKELIINDI